MSELKCQNNCLDTYMICFCRPEIQQNRLTNKSRNDLFLERTIHEEAYSTLGVHHQYEDSLANINGTDAHVHAQIHGKQPIQL